VTATFSIGAYSYTLGNVYGSFGKLFMGSGAGDFITADAQEDRRRPPTTGDFLEVIGNLSFSLTMMPDYIFSEARFDEPASWTLSGDGGVSTAHLDLAIRDTSGSEMIFIEGPYRTADLDLTFQTLNVAAVPEPATWAMMIAGFGLSGAALRRRRLAPTA
jgi:hypothetical protein